MDIEWGPIIAYPGKEWAPDAENGPVMVRSRNGVWRVANDFAEPSWSNVTAYRLPIAPTPGVTPTPRVTFTAAIYGTVTATRLPSGAVRIELRDPDADTETLMSDMDACLRSVIGPHWARGKDE